MKLSGKIKRILKLALQFVVGPVAIIFVGMPLLGSNGFGFYLAGTIVLLFLWFIPWEIAERRASDNVVRKVVLENSLSANSAIGDLQIKSDTGFLPDFVTQYSPLSASQKFESNSYMSGTYNGVRFEQAHVNDTEDNTQYSGTLYVIHLDINEEKSQPEGLANKLYKVNDDNVCVYISDEDPNKQMVMEIIDGLK